MIKSINVYVCVCVCVCVWERGWFQLAKLADVNNKRDNGIITICIKCCLNAISPKNRTAYFFWFGHPSQNGDDECDRWWGCFCNLSLLAEQKASVISFFRSFSLFFIKYICWVRIASLPVKPTHWKWTLSYFLSHSLDETENGTNEVTETNKLDWLDRSGLSHCLPTKSALDFWVDQRSHCLGWGLLSFDLSVASGHGYLEKILFA